MRQPVPTGVDGGGKRRGVREKAEGRSSNLFAGLGPPHAGIAAAGRKAFAAGGFGTQGPACRRGAPGLRLAGESRSS